MTIGLQQGARPHVRFEVRSEEDRNASIEEKKKVYRDVDWVIITPVGGKDYVENRAEQWLANISDRAMVGQYDAEWVEHFKRMYAMFKQGKDLPVDGTSLKMLTTLFSPAEIQNCLAANVHTLEQLADANEEALSRLPMIGRALKTRAQEAIRLGEGKGDSLKLEALQIENDQLKQQVAEQQQKLATLAEIVTELQTKAALGEAPARRGRAAQSEAA